MGILIIQSSTWVIWFCDIAITPLARAWPADPALCLQLGIRGVARILEKEGKDNVIARKA